jgi:hypothetical protein
MTSCRWKDTSRVGSLKDIEGSGMEQAETDMWSFKDRFAQH